MIITPWLWRSNLVAVTSPPPSEPCSLDSISTRNPEHSSTKVLHTSRYDCIWKKSVYRGTGKFNAADILSDRLVPIKGCAEEAVATELSVVAEVAAFTLLLADPLRTIWRVRLVFSTSPRRLGIPSKKNLFSTSSFFASVSSFRVPDSLVSSLEWRTISSLRRGILFWWFS